MSEEKNTVGEQLSEAMREANKGLAACPKAREVLRVYARALTTEDERDSDTTENTQQKPGERVQEHIARVARELAHSLEETILDSLPPAVDRRAPVAELARRIIAVTRYGKPGTTYTVDGRPFLWVGELTAVESNGKIRFSRPFRRLGTKENT